MISQNKGCLTDFIISHTSSLPLPEDGHLVPKAGIFDRHVGRVSRSEEMMTSYSNIHSYFGQEMSWKIPACLQILSFTFVVELDVVEIEVVCIFMHLCLSIQFYTYASMLKAYSHLYIKEYGVILLVSGDTDVTQRWGLERLLMITSVDTSQVGVWR